MSWRRASSGVKRTPKSASYKVWNCCTSSGVGVGRFMVSSCRIKGLFASRVGGLLFGLCSVG